jgi:hypothetical protein
LYELVDNYQAQSVAEQNYLIAKRDFRRKIWRIKEPLIRELPDEDIDFFSN